MNNIDILLAAGTAYLPQVIGGLETNTHELALELNRRGYKTAVFAKLSPRDMFGVKKLLSLYRSGSRICVDRNLGYEVYRSRNPSREVGRIKAKVGVIQNGDMLDMAATLRRTGVPCVAYFHGLPFESSEHHWTEPSAQWPFRAYIANSQYTASRFRARFGIDGAVIEPIFRPERYRTTRHPQFVTFVNPVPPKGLPLALDIAAICREIPFRFVKAWPLSMRETLRLTKAVSRLPNVELVARTMDMRSVYATTRVLLVPSQWKAETWGRVASEAQFSGIPVLASDVGGLPEAVGPGGIVLKHSAPAGVWASALRRLWNDSDCYGRMSTAALLHSQREAINLDRQVDRFVAVLAPFLSDHQQVVRKARAAG